MDEARAQTVHALRSFPNVQAWAFEFTPASSSDPVSTYLNKVRQADFVIWLVGDRTTPPVRDEIHAALSCNRPILVFRLPVDQRDEMTLILLEDVGKRVKWVDVDTSSSLADAVVASVSDEFVRAVRKRPSHSREELLNQLTKSSEARCIVRWQASGLPRAKAIAWARESERGLPDSACFPTDSNPLRILTANLGGGKSLAAERLLQRAIDTALNDESAPLPMYFTAQEVESDAYGIISRKCGEVGHPVNLGVFVVVDGLDDLNSSRGFAIVNECRKLLTEYPSSRALLTSRPIGAITRMEERVVLPTLEDEEVMALALEASGTQATHSIWALPKPVREVVKYPLFAILLGLYWGQRSNELPSTAGQLIEFLARRVVPTDSSEGQQREKLLMKAARLAIEREGSVPLIEVGSEGETEALLRSPVVSVEDGWLRFTLPVLLHWFAAQSLSGGNPPLTSLNATARTLDAWHHALVVFAASQSTTKVGELFDFLATEEPGEAALVVTEAVGGWGASSQGPLPPPLECGPLMRRAMAGWLTGLGPLGQSLGPTNSEGDLCTLGVGGTNNHLVVSWHRTETHPEVVELPSSLIDQLLAKDWRGVQAFTPSRQSGWPWRWALESLQSQIATLIRSRFLCRASPLAEAEMFEQMVLLAGNRPLVGGPVDLEHVARLLREIEDADLVKVDNEQFDPDPLVQYVQAARENGLMTMPSPFPEPDMPRLTNGHMSSLYSEEQVKSLVETAYSNALSGYLELVESFFPKIKRRLRTYATLPAVLKGTLTWTPTGRVEEPVLDWHLLPLRQGESRVEIGWASPEAVPAERFDDALEDLQAEYVLARGVSHPWLYASTHSEVLRVYSLRGANSIAYSWLWRDLADTSWITSHGVPYWG